MVYNATFERGVMMQLAETFDDLAPALRAHGVDGCSTCCRSPASTTTTRR